MARVTVEDCIIHVPNRFELVVLAANRAKQISSGSQLTVERDNDKDAVISLREIADKTIELGQIKEDIVQSFRKKQVIESLSKPVEKTNTEVQEMLAEEGKQVEDEDVSEHLSVGVHGKAGLSFETDNVEAED